MSVKICTVYDSKGQCYMPPNNYKNVGEALREFETCANDEKSKINKWPADFTLFELGSFDESTCKYTLHDSPISLGNAIEFLSSQKGTPNAEAA